MSISPNFAVPASTPPTTAGRQPTWAATPPTRAGTPSRAGGQPTWASVLRPGRAGQGIPREGGADGPSRKNFDRRESRITKRFDGGSRSVEGHDRAYRPKPRVWSLDDV